MTFDEIEEQRERAGWEDLVTAGLADEGLDPDRLEDILAYSLDDPKHPDYHSIHADIYDAREGK